VGEAHVEEAVVATVLPEVNADYDNGILVI
jgi:hypothetical protein